MDAFIAAWTSAESPPLGLRPLGRWLADQCRPLVPGDCPPERMGVYLASADAGVQPSLDFWREAVATGVGFANPAAFPWTLASSPASHIALDLHLQGPNLTIVGGGEAALAVIQHALGDLARGRIDHALVGALGLLGPLRLAAVWLRRQPGAALLCWTAPVLGGAAVAIPHASPVDVFCELVGALEANTLLTLADPLEGTLRLVPPPASPSLDD